MPTAQTGGGSATHSGTNYQNRVAAWVGTRILAEKDATAPWDLPSSTTLDFLQCETLEPVDDILVGTSESGHAFVQAKHTIALGTTEDSEFASVIDQFVKQFHLRQSRGHQSSWDRPLDKTLDRLVLVTSSGASARVRNVLPTVLNRIAALTPTQEIEASAVTEEEKEVLGVFKTHVSRAWRDLKGLDPTKNEIGDLAALIRVQTLDVDLNENQEREAKDLLRLTALKKPSDTDLAWNRLVQACASYAADRTGATRSALQQVLISAGIDLEATRSYRADVERIKHLSLSSLQTLSSLSEIRVTSNQVVKLTRACTGELRTAAMAGSLVVVGQPGAGKSGALHDLARSLELDGDVVVFSVDQFDASSLGTLRSEMGCNHEIVDVLRNWPGTKPGFLIIDALDAARTETGAKTFRDLIGSTLALNSRWRVIPSIRKFDLRYSSNLQALFPGSPPSLLFDPEFRAIRHLEVPVFSDAELALVRSQSNELGAIISNASAELIILLRVPFNLRLIAEMLGTGVAASSLTPIRTQLELLERYWRERVIGSDMQADARETVLRRATNEMVNRRSLRIDRAAVASDPSASIPLHQVLSAHVLTEWQSSPDQAANRYIITYAHHILYDYAVARLMFRGPLSELGRVFKFET